MSVLRNASGRLAAMQAHRAEVEKQRDYLETVIELSRRGAMSLFSTVAEGEQWLQKSNPGSAQPRPME